MTAEQPIVQFDGIVKNFGSKKILNKASFVVPHTGQGQIIALLGVNGAGKTTCLKMLLGQEVPDEGQVLLWGKPPSIPHNRMGIGSTPQNVQFPDGLSVREVLSFVSLHYPNPVSQSTIVQRFLLEDLLLEKAKNLSGGQKRKLALALAFMGNPSLVFLDEPTTGLDAASRKLLWDIILHDATKETRTIFLTTHYLEEIERVATRLLVLNNGMITFDGNVADIKKQVQSLPKKVLFYLPPGVNLPQPLSSLYGVDEVIYIPDTNAYTLVTKDPDQVIRGLVERQIPFVDLYVERQNLESAFLHMTKKD